MEVRAATGRKLLTPRLWPSLLTPRLPSACPETAGGRAGKSSLGTAAGRPARQGFNERQLKGYHWKVPVTTEVRSRGTDQRLGVAEHVVLQKLMEHVEEVVLDKCLDDKFM